MKLLHLSALSKLPNFTDSFTIIFPRSPCRLGCHHGSWDRFLRPLGCEGSSFARWDQKGVQKTSIKISSGQEPQWRREGTYWEMCPSGRPFMERDGCFYFRTHACWNEAAECKELSGKLSESCWGLFTLPEVIFSRQLVKKKVHLSTVALQCNSLLNHHCLELHISPLVWPGLQPSKRCIG